LKDRYSPEELPEKYASTVDRTEDLDFDDSRMIFAKFTSSDEFVKALEKTDNHSFRSLAAAEWLNREPSEAAAWMMENGRKGGYQHVIKDIFDDIDSRDDQLTIYSQMSEQMRPALVRTVTPQTIPDSMEMFDSVSSAGERERLAIYIAPALAEIDQAKALEWCESQKEPNVRSTALFWLIPKWAKLDSLALSEWATNLPPGRIRDRAAEGVVQSTILSEPESAFQWASYMDDETLRQRTLKNVINRWQRQSPEDAARAIVGSDLDSDAKQGLLKLLVGGGQ
jgi:hypothetical protein